MQQGLSSLWVWNVWWGRPLTFYTCAYFSSYLVKSLYFSKSEYLSNFGTICTLAYFCWHLNCQITTDPNSKLLLTNVMYPPHPQKTQNTIRIKWIWTNSCRYILYFTFESGISIGQESILSCWYTECSTSRWPTWKEKSYFLRRSSICSIVKFWPNGVQQVPRKVTLIHQSCIFNFDHQQNSIDKNPHQQNHNLTSEAQKCGRNTNLHCF